MLPFFVAIIPVTEIDGCEKFVQVGGLSFTFYTLLM